MDLVAVTGRFQPVHLDHLDLMRVGLSMGDVLIVGITNPDRRSLIEHSASSHRHTDEANPYTYFQRALWVRDSLLEAGVPPGRFLITPFPLEAPDTWTSYIPASAHQLVRTYSPWEDSKADALRAVYRTTVIKGDPETKIAATAVRSGIAGDTDDWRALVPAPVARSFPGALR